MEHQAVRQDQALRQWPVMLLLLAGLYLVLHPYLGLVHDSRIYTLQALNLLRPDLYGNDVYLKFGSQDSYTVFSPLYARMIRLFGTEHAASLLTLFSTATLLLAAWWLARGLMPARLVWLAIGVLILVPGYYSPDEFFALLEGFITPRPLAQALVLCALAAWMRGFRLACAGLLFVALLIHPIMAFSGILLLLAIWGLQHWRRLWPLAAAGLALAITAVADWIPLDRWQFDSAWWPMVGRENLLLLGEWTAADWARIVTVQSTLVFAAVLLPDPTRRFACGLLATSAAALLLSWIGGDLLRIVIVIQGQAWRALWLATAFAALLLPWVASTCLRSSPLHRAGLLLLVAAWVLGHQGIALLFAIPAILVLARAGYPASDRPARIAMLAAVTILAVVVLCTLALTATELMESGRDPTSRTWLQGLRVASTDRILPCALLLGGWYLCTRLRAAHRRVALALAVALPAAAVATGAVRPWVNETYPEAVHEAFAGWRKLIPPGNDVLWVDSIVAGSDPSSVWLLLERPSYYSSVQVNSALFSREAALELRRRHLAIPNALPTEQSVKVVYADAPAPGCEELPVKYAVASTNIVGAKVVPAPANIAPPFDRMKLQVCP